MVTLSKCKLAQRAGAIAGLLSGIDYRIDDGFVVAAAESGF